MASRWNDSRERTVQAKGNSGKLESRFAVHVITHNSNIANRMNSVQKELSGFREFTN
jgi:hypothetical protein